MGTIVVVVVVGVVIIVVIGVVVMSGLILTLTIARCVRIIVISIVEYVIGPVVVKLGIHVVVIIIIVIVVIVVPW